MTTTTMSNLRQALASVGQAPSRVEADTLCWRRLGGGGGSAAAAAMTVALAAPAVAAAARCLLPPLPPLTLRFKRWRWR